MKRLKADAADLWLAKAQDTGPLTNWISDAHPQGGTDVQSPVSCLDYRDVVSDAVCSHISVVSEVYIYIYIGTLLITDCDPSHRTIEDYPDYS